MEIVYGQVFEHECVSLDNKQFISCTFTGCILEYRGGEVILDQTLISQCRHVFYGRARRTLHYLQGVGLMDYRPSDWGEFDDQVH